MVQVGLRLIMETILVSDVNSNKVEGGQVDRVGYVTAWGNRDGRGPRGPLESIVKQWWVTVAGLNNRILFWPPDREAVEKK